MVTAAFQSGHFLRVLFPNRVHPFARSLFWNYWKGLDLVVTLILGQHGAALGLLG